jgi:BASS family bile acid:Na+ symporter
VTRIHLAIQVLTCSALVGLLAAVGLRLTMREVKAALLACRLTAIVLVNFVAVPVLALAGASWFGLNRSTGIAMLLLAAAPFAPVVPVFARMARADLALAAGLTAGFPLLAILLTPLVAELGLRILGNADGVEFNMLTSLATLMATISLPLAIGILLRHWAPGVGRRLLRPMEIASEATGAASLAFVTVTEFGSIINLGWKAWLCMALISELSLLAGWMLGGPGRGTRQVVALGSSNRNIALALLIAVQSFPGTPVVSAVVGNGLLLIGLGLVHVGWWRFIAKAPPSE